MSLTGHTVNEQMLYGKTWDTVHDGYFADPKIASPLVEAILDAADETRPSVIADLGGGTGFVLEEVYRRIEQSPAPSPVCVDIAREQLEQCPEPISRVECSVEGVKREMLVVSGGSLMLCMRSVLHYLGREMLKPDLSHLRSILKEGECFVHQTICFQSEAEQAIANLLFERMDTGKWLPTVRFLVEALEEEGFEVADLRPAAPLQCTSDVLEERYGFTREEMTEIGRDLEEQCEGHLREVFHKTRHGFTAYLEYMVLTCFAR